MLLQYAIAQTLVVALGVYIYVDAYPNEEKFNKYLFQGLNSSIHNYGLDVLAGEKSLTDDWDKMQENVIKVIIIKC